MKSVNELKDSKDITTLYPYYRSDIFASLLIESGFDPEQIVITRREGSRGGYAHDIERVSIKYPYLYPDDPYVEIQTGDEGIYDNTPEDLYFVADHSHRERDKQHVIARIKENRKREEDLRLFFRLYEAEADAFRIEISRRELHYQQAGRYSDLRTLFSNYWEVVALMKNDEFIRMLRVIPFVADMRGDYAAASGAVSYILGIRVKIETVKVRMKPAGADVETSEAPVLGVNSILGSGDECVEERIRVTLSDVGRESWPLYFENNDYHRIVLFLAEMFVEATRDIDLDIVAGEDSSECYIGDRENMAYLGLNTYL